MLGGFPPHMTKPAARKVRHRTGTLKGNTGPRTSGREISRVPEHFVVLRRPRPSECTVLAAAAAVLSVGLGHSHGVLPARPLSLPCSWLNGAPAVQSPGRPSPPARFGFEEDHGDGFLQERGDNVTIAADLAFVQISVPENKPGGTRYNFTKKILEVGKDRNPRSASGALFVYGDSALVSSRWIRGGAFVFIFQSYKLRMLSGW